MNKYEKPMIEVLKVTATDLLTASDPTYNPNGETPYQESKEGFFDMSGNDNVMDIINNN